MYSLSKIEEIVCKALEIQPENRSAFSAKVKYYRKQNFPKLPKTGKGSRSEFSERAALQLLTVFRLEQLGFPPKLAIRGAIAISGAIGENGKIPARPYLCFNGHDLAVVSADHVHEIINAEKSATLVSIGELLNFFRRGISEVPTAPIQPVEELMSVVDHILEHRDGCDKR